MTLAACQWHGFHRAALRGSDYFIYSSAVERAWKGEDPYLPHSIGWGYLYPPSSLLVLRAMGWAAPQGLRPETTFLLISAVSAATAILLLAWPVSSAWSATVVALLLVSSGLVETLAIGQINALVLLVVSLLIWAWERRKLGLASAALGVAICLKATPAWLAILFLRRGTWRWLGVTAGIAVGFNLAAEIFIPAPPLTQSYLEAIRWAAARQVPSEWNHALSAHLPETIALLTGRHVSWGAVHVIKVFSLATLLLASFSVWVRQGDSPLTRANLVAAATTGMVLAPNLLWLHHAALLIPAFWFLLTATRDPLVVGGALIAWVCIQGTRCLQAALQVSPEGPMQTAQVVLYLSCTVLCWRAMSERPAPPEAVSNPLATAAGGLGGRS